MILVDDLNVGETLESEAMAATKGGFWDLFGLEFLSISEDQIGEECNNGICVPYQQEEGNY